MKDFFSFYHDMRSKPVYFILGPQGSGSNLTSNLFIKVFGCEAVRDRSLIFNAAVRIKKDNSSIKKEVDYVIGKLFPNAFNKRFFGGKHYHHQNKNYIGIGEFVSKVPMQTAEDFAYFFYAYHAWKNGHDMIAVKSDDIWENLEHLESIFSNGRFILLVRDPRDNALSVMRKNFGPRDIYVSSKYIKQRLNIYTRFCEKHENRGLMIKYEDILNQPVECVRKIAQKFEMTIPTDLEERIESLKIRPYNSQKWRRLSDNDLLIAETILLNELKQFGYETVNQTFYHIDKNTAFKHNVNDMWQRVPQKLKYVFGNIVSP